MTSGSYCVPKSPQSVPTVYKPANAQCPAGSRVHDQSSLFESQRAFSKALDNMLHGDVIGEKLGHVLIN